MFIFLIKDKIVISLLICMCAIRNHGDARKYSHIQIIMRLDPLKPCFRSIMI